MTSSLEHETAHEVTPQKLLFWSVAILIAFGWIFLGFYTTAILVCNSTASRLGTHVGHSLYRRLFRLAIPRENFERTI